MSPSTDERHGTPPQAPLHLLLAGGGTGGHIFPALAVGAAVLREGGRVSYLGTARGMEARLVAAAGIPFHALPARPWVGGGPGRKAAALATLPVATARAWRLARRLRPEVVLGTGSYVAVPAVLGARLAGRPALLLEPNATPGVANRVLSRFAAGSCVAHPEAAAALHGPAWLTGVPVREAFFRVPAALAGGPPSLLVLGGSQGAVQLNRVLPPVAERLGRALPAARILHQTGEGHLAAVRADYARRSLEGVAVETVAFLDDVAGALAAAHLVVSRAGAITLAELTAAGRGAVLLPLALAGGHQRGNAEALAAAGAAVVVGSEEDGPEALAALLAPLLADRERLIAMAAAARARGRADAVPRILERLLAVRRAR